MADTNDLSAMAVMEMQLGDSDLSLIADYAQGQASQQDGATSTPAAASVAKVKVKSSKDEDAVRSGRMFDGSPVRFGVDTSMRSGARIQRQSTGIYRPSSTAAPVATAVVASMDDLGSVSEASASSFNRKKGDSILKNAKKRAPAPVKSAPKNNHSRQLTAISAQYDLDGDGVLNEIEQAMRDRDIDGDGKLDNAEVYQIVQDQLKSQTDYNLYKKVAAGLLCLVAILSVSSFGTSMAAAILTKESVVDKDSGTIQTKSGEIMGFQETSHLIDLEELSDEEFDERRRLVDAEMAEDPNHPDHLHRQLGKKKNKGNGVVTQIAYDRGAISETDLVSLTRKCNGVNTVQMRRTWSDGAIMDRSISRSVSEDYDTICSPGTVIKQKGKKKNNKNKTKTKVVNELITFEREGLNGQDQSISFACNSKKGKCYSSGETLHQRAGHPCKIQNDFAGASECQANLACYNPKDHFATTGKGECTKLQKQARQNQICDINLGVNACESSYACYSKKGRTTKISVGTVPTGLCNRVARSAGANEVCDVTFKADACVGGYRCFSADGREIGKKGIGVCSGCLPSGASFATDCTDTKRCSGGRTCLSNCMQGSDRWFCY